MSSSKSHSAHKATLRPWGNLSSALQPVATPGGAQDPYPHPQLMPDALKKQNGKRQETDGNMQQLLQELAHAQGGHAVLCWAHAVAAMRCCWVVLCCVVLCCEARLSCLGWDALGLLSSAVLRLCHAELCCPVSFGLG